MRIMIHACEISEDLKTDLGTEGLKTKNADSKAAGEDFCSNWPN